MQGGGGVQLKFSCLLGGQLTASMPGLGLSCKAGDQRERLLLRGWVMSTFVFCSSSHCT